MASLIVPQAAPASRYDDPGIIDTIRNTVAKGANDSELKMFLEVCKATGLNPFLKEIWYVAATKTIMAGRDGYLRKANEDPMFDGMETRVERDSQNIPVKAICTVWRKDRNHPIICEAYYSEYKKAGNVWNQYPSAMIAKVSEVLALKRSFSINGVVTQEEIGDEEPAPRGSKEAAQAVGQQKIEQFAKDRHAREAAAQAATSIMCEAEALAKGPVYEAVPEDRPVFNDEPGLQPPHDEQLEASLKAHPPKIPAKFKGKLTATEIEVRKWFGPLHEGYTALGKESRYKDILWKWGVEKCTGFAVINGGPSDRAYQQALECRNYMQIDLQTLKAKLHPEPAA